MKKIKISIFGIILLGIFAFNNIYEVRADSGFDGSYGGGGSSGGSSSSSGSYGGIGDFSIGAYILFMIMMFIVYIVCKVQERQTNKKITEKLNNIKSLDIEKIRKIVPRFNLEKFRMETYEIYKRIQIAWMNFDEEELRKYLTDEVYNMYVSQLKTLKLKNEKNIIKDFDLYNFNILDVKKEGETISIKTNMQILCYDYITRTKGKKNIKGYVDTRVLYNYEITFIKTNKYKGQNKYCPNCGANITNNASNKCEYCDSIIVSNDYNWVMSKKEVVEQYSEDQIINK